MRRKLGCAAFCGWGEVVDSGIGSYGISLGDVCEVAALVWMVRRTDTSQGTFFTLGHGTSGAIPDVRWVVCTSLETFHPVPTTCISALTLYVCVLKLRGLEIIEAIEAMIGLPEIIN